MCSVTNPPSPNADHVPLSKLVTPKQELQALSSQLMPGHHCNPLPSLTALGELLSQRGIDLAREQGQ